MNIEETTKLLTMIQCIYPKKNEETMNFELTCKLWQKLFQDVTWREAYYAFMQHSSLSKFSPHPAELKELVIKNRNPEAFKSAESAWEDVALAAKKFGWYRQKEAYESLDAQTLRIVKTIGWDKICHSEKIEFVKKDFCNNWDNISSSEQESLKLPFPRQVHVLDQDVKK